MLALTNELTRLEVEESGTQVALRMIGFAGDKLAVYLDADQALTLYTQLGSWVTRDEPFVSDVV
jgi:hypothetical protein